MSNSKYQQPLTIKGRGADSNTSGRFEKIQSVSDLSDFGFAEEDEFHPIKTEFFRDTSKSIVAENQSPDIPFSASINPYRGCEHGCIYCYARPTHEYLGLSPGLDFESKIFVKETAPELLREKLMSKSWKPQWLAISGVTDCYQPVERHFGLTRKCLEVLLEFRNPVGVITKNHLITRDIDILQELAKNQLVSACLSVTSLDSDLARKLEPRTSSPRLRLKAIEELAKAGIPVSVNIAPVIPGLTDHEIPQILKAACEAGARWAGYVPVRLPYSVKDLFSDWLERHFPDRRDKVLNSIRDLRGGKLNDGNFESRMEGQGPQAEKMAELFRIFSGKYHFNEERLALRTDLFRRPTDQLSFFEGS